MLRIQSQRPNAVNSRSQLVLSLFPGIDLLGRAFAAEGFCVVRGPDLLTGDRIEDFQGIAGKLDGIVAGPPCQGFSSANPQRSNADHRSVQNSRECLRHFVRVVEQCQPTWFVCENVPAVPDVKPRVLSRDVARDRTWSFYPVQRLAISDEQCGGVQIRMRHIQFGHRLGHIIRPQRSVKRRRRIGRKAEAITTKPVSRWSSFSEQCRKQGLDETVQLPGMTKAARFRAVGNAVPMTIGRVIAASVNCASPRTDRDCPCGCGRQLEGKQRAATSTCRKWLQLDRERARAFVDIEGFHPACETAGNKASES